MVYSSRSLYSYIAMRQPSFHPWVYSMPYLHRRKIRQKQFLISKYRTSLLVSQTEKSDKSHRELTRPMELSASEDSLVELSVIQVYKKRVLGE